MEWLRALLDGQPQAESGPIVDLTVEEVAELFGKTPQTIRDWLRTCQLEGYKLHAKQWRVPPASIKEFQERQRNGGSSPATGGNGRGANLGEWRNHHKSGEQY